MTTAAAVITRAGALLHDPGQVRWSEADMLGYVSDAQRAVVRLKPSANPVTATIQLDPGTEQSLPADSCGLIRVVRSMGLDGLSPGSAPRSVSRSQLDAVQPDWHTATARVSPLEYVYDDRDPDVFHVNPPQPDPAGHLQVVYGGVPAELTATTDVLVVSDLYLEPMTNFAASRALARESSTQNLAKAAAYYELFEAAVMEREVAQSKIRPLQLPERARTP